MCLYNVKKLYPTEDITCYKILKKIDDDTFVSPYYGNKSKKWILNKIKKSKTKTINIHDGYCVKYIEEKAFHSLKTVQDAMKYSTGIMHSFANYQDYFLFKCVIPKSSKEIYEGICSSALNVNKGYASTELKPIELICPIHEIEFSNEYINFI